MSRQQHSNHGGSLMTSGTMLLETRDSFKTAAIRGEGDRRESKTYQVEQEDEFMEDRLGKAVS